MQKSKEIGKFYRDYMLLITSSKNHNIKNCIGCIENLEKQENQLWDNLLSFIEEAKSEIEAIKISYTDGSEYASKLYKSLLDKNLPAEFQDDILTIGPINIEIDLEGYLIILSVGRKKKKIYDLELTKATKVIEQFYKRINSSFNVNSFISRLVKAYGFVNKGMYTSRKVQYGNAVPLDDIFKIFTISPSATDYKIENFLWDLGRMSSTQLSNVNYQIELGFSRNIGRTLIIKDINGNINKYSTLTVYKKD